MVGAPIDKIARAIDDFPSLEAFGALACLAGMSHTGHRSGPSRSRLACIQNPFYPRTAGLSSCALRKSYMTDFCGDGS